VSDLLFLYECATRDAAQLRTLADRLGLTVQAASHTFRGLSRRGLVEIRDGRYRPTVAGVDWLHSALGGLQVDLAERLDRLHIVRTTRALARSTIPAGASVVLSVEDGMLVARPGSRGPSRGIARTAARRGELVEVEELEGIVPLRPGTVRVLTLPVDELGARGLVSALSAALGPNPPGLLAAQGLEAYHLLGQAAPERPILRFGIAAGIEEATQLGIDCVVVVLDREAPRLLHQFEGTQPPTIDFVAVHPARRLPRRGR
jgi:predicted transcriptional regulator